LTVRVKASYKENMSDTDPFEIALKEARKSLAEAYEERSAIEKRIVRLKQTIDGLAALCEPKPDEDLVQVQGGYLPDGYNTSLTDAIRGIFSETTEPMLTPVKVRNALLAMGVKLAKYKQPMVPIHNTLKRLEAQGELVPFRDDAGDLRGYRWVSPLARAVAEVSPLSEGKRALFKALRGEAPSARLPSKHASSMKLADCLTSYREAESQKKR
jgi:hypothetical protein